MPELKGTNLGITSRNGSQHLVANRLLAAGGLDPAKDVTTVVIGGAPALLQALLAGSIQVTALSPPTIIVARDKFKVNILADTPKDFVSTQGGFAVTDRNLADKRDLVRRMMRARTKAYRYFHENEKGTSETLAKYTKLGFAGARNLSHCRDSDLPPTAFLPTPTWKLAETRRQSIGFAQPVPAQGLRFHSSTRSQ